VALAAWATTTVAWAQPANLTIPVEQYQLANGLEVILHQDRSIPIIHVNVTYHVGSGNETPGQSGYAHLFEHLMFQGTKHTGLDQHFAILRDIGARGSNGTTNSDRTNYFQSVPAGELETALWLESDRMGYLLLDQEALENQREVVRNERRASYENVAYKEEIFAVARALYPEGHPYRYLTIGLHEDLQRATLEDARSFFARWYVPANATLVLAGDFDVQTARGLIDKWFGSFPVSRRPRVKVPPPPVLGARHREQFADPLATTTRVRYVWPTPAFFTPGDAELDVIAQLLASDTGRLRRLVTSEKSLARSVSASQTSRGFSSEFHIVVDVRPGANVDDVHSAIDTALSALSRSATTERELKQAIVSLEVNMMRGLETLAARANRLQLYSHHGKPAGSAAWDLQRYRNVTLADIRATAMSLLTDKRVEMVTVPMAGMSAAERPTPPGKEVALPLESLETARLPRLRPAPVKGGN
jgi:predicted Zn-dependent peptidase